KERGQKQERRQQREREVVGKLSGAIENLVMHRPPIDARNEPPDGPPSERPARGHPAALSWSRPRKRSHFGPIVAGSPRNRAAAGGKLLPFQRAFVVASEASRNPVGLPDFKSGGPF